MRTNLSNIKEWMIAYSWSGPGMATVGPSQSWSGVTRTSYYRSCYRVLGDPEDARDASQEAFIRAYRKLDTFRGHSAFKTWVLRIAMNVGLNERSRRELPRTDIVSAESIPGTEVPEAELLRSEAAAQVHKALQLVQPNHRAAIVLRDLEGLTYEEIGEYLAIPEGTAKSWVHRGRGRLKELLT